MRVKDLNISVLLDYYGELLGDRKRDVLGMYYNEDFSLAEISQIIGISRQGVRDVIKKSEADLFFYEEKLGLLRRFSALREEVDRADILCKQNSVPVELSDSIRRITDLLQ